MKEEKAKLKELISENEVISFDVFDTLLLRNVLKPTDLFQLLEKDAWNQFQIPNFSNERIDAEKNSRIGHENMETTLEDIYTFLEKKYQKKLHFLKQLELQLEEKFLIPNPFMKEIYEYAKEQGKTLVVISDMYLPKNFIQKILKKCGYEIPLVYVSSDGFQVKGNGSLFQKVEKENHFVKSKWLHIGDNFISDVKTPHELGMNSYHYLPVSKRSGFENESNCIEESILKGIIQNHCFTKELSYWEKFGMIYVAPIYFGFTNWLFKETKDLDSLYFLARDGYMIQKIYDLFKEKFSLSIDTYYLYCSRVAYFLPTLENEEKDFVLEVLTRYSSSLKHQVKIKNIMDSIGLDLKDYEKNLASYSLTLDTILNEQNKNRIKEFLGSIYEEILECFSKKRKLLIEYLKSMNLFKYDKISIMDIGWGGSTQYALTKVLKKKVYGYYFGTRKEMYPNMEKTSKAYFFELEKPEENFEMVMKNVMMFEFLFSAPHGTTLRFKKEKGKITPILEENSTVISSIKEFQESAFYLCKEFLNYYEELKEIDSSITISLYQKFILKKNYQDMKMFCSMEESIGSDGSKISFVPVFSLQQIEKNLDSFYEEITGSLWKNSFFIENKTEKEYNKFQEKMFDFKYYVWCQIKYFHLKRLYQLIRYPRTTKRFINELKERKKEYDKEIHG